MLQLLLLLLPTLATDMLQLMATLVPSTSTLSSLLTPMALLSQLMNQLLPLPELTILPSRDKLMLMLQLLMLLLPQLLPLQLSLPQLLLLPVLTIWPPRDCMEESMPMLDQLYMLLDTPHMLVSRPSPTELLSQLMSQLLLLPVLTILPPKLPSTK